MKFRGGYRFRNFDGAAASLLHELPVPDKVILSIPDGMEVSVSPGETVQAGTSIMRDRGGSSLCFPSSVSGTVSSIDTHSITISSDGSSTFEPVSGHPREPWRLEKSDVFEIFARTGCSFLFDNPFRSLEDCSIVHHLVINAVHNSPLNQSFDPETIGSPTTFLHGLQTLKAIYDTAEIVVAINRRNRKYFDTPELRKLAKTVILSDRYPQEFPEMIARDALQKQLVSPEGTIDTSISFLQFADVIHIAEVMTEGRPLIDRILVAAGPGVSRPAWYRIRLGTTLDELKVRLFKWEYAGPWRIIRGNPLVGTVVEPADFSVLPSDHELSSISEHADRELFKFVMPGIAADSYPKITVAAYFSLMPKKIETNIHGGVRPCVQCNYCDEVCPVDLYPFMIWKNVTADEMEESFRFRPHDCISCGLCDYVCPSKISLYQSISQAKEAYHEQRRSADVSD